MDGDSLFVFRPTEGNETWSQIYCKEKKRTLIMEEEFFQVMRIIL